MCCYVIAQERADLPEGYPRNTTDEPPSYFSKIDHGSNNEQRTTNNTSNLFFYRCPQQPFYRTYLRPQQPTLTLINTPPVRGPARSCYANANNTCYTKTERLAWTILATNFAFVDLDNNFYLTFASIP